MSKELLSYPRPWRVRTFDGLPGFYVVDCDNRVIAIFPPSDEDEELAAALVLVGNGPDVCSECYGQSCLMAIKSIRL